jgi:branched-chain amino acid transport system substrate-binding protein
VVAKEPYHATDPSIGAQVDRLARSGADVFYDVTSPKFAAQAIAAVAKTDWKPLHIVSNVSASKSLVFAPAGLEHAKGIISAAYLKEPEGAEWKADPAMVEYRDMLAKYAPKLNPNEYFNVYGWSEAQMMAAALDGMREPTREALMESARNLDFQVGTMLPGVRVQTTPTDGYPIEALRVQRFDGSQWRPVGEVVSAPGN